MQSAFRQVVLTKVTAAFFVFSLLLCFSQGIINAVLFSIDSEYETVVHGVVNAAALPQPEIADLRGTLGSLTLRVCDDIPYYGRADKHCITVVDPLKDLTFEDFPIERFRRDEASSQGASVSAGDAKNPIVVSREEVKTLSVEVTPPSNATDALVKLVLKNSVTHYLDARCTRTLLYADKVLRNSKREEVVFVALQFWIFGMSFIAIIFNSIPHTVAVLGARILMTAWSAFTLWRSQNNFARFKELYFNQSRPTPCNLVLGFTDYFQDRSDLQIPEVILNCTGLLISAYMSWTLIKTFHETKLMRVGAPPAVLRLYKYFMAVLVCLQLGAFILMSTLGLWADELFSIFEERISEHTVAYKALIVITSVLVIPIGTLGWISIKRERRMLMGVFLFMLFALLAGWGTMFGSQIFRWTFMDWPLLAGLNVASLVLIIASMTLGVICWLNFDKGLGHYFYVEDILASSDFTPGVFTEADSSRSDIKEKDLEGQFYVRPARVHLPVPT